MEVLHNMVVVQWGFLHIVVIYTEVVCCQWIDVTDVPDGTYSCS